MGTKRGSQQLTLVCTLLLSLCAAEAVGPSVPTPSLKQELDEGMAAWFLVAASSVTLSYDQQDLLISVRQEVSAKSSAVNAARQAGGVGGGRRCLRNT